MFLRWGQTAFRNFRVVPPETGIVHQVNIEYLARVVCQRHDGRRADRVSGHASFGTDSHTTMVNGLGVVGWGVGGIEAEAAMLGQPSSMLIPPVVGYRLTGALPEGATATDLVLTITEALRKKGVVGKFVEFYGPGLAHLTIADRATLGNMCPEYGATVAIFPIDDDDARLPAAHRPRRGAGRAGRGVREGAGAVPHRRRRRTPSTRETLELDLATVEPSLAGPAASAGSRAAASARSASFAARAARAAEGRRRSAPAAAPAEQRSPSATAVASSSTARS